MGSAIRAGHSAGAAANALLLVNPNDTGLRIFVDSALRAHFHANRVIAVVAANRQRIAETGSVDAASFVAGSFATGVLNHTAMS